MTSTVIPWLNSQIADLTRENERLRRDLEGMYEHDREQSAEVSQVHRELDAETNRAVAAEDEVERLRAALKGVLAEADRKTDAFDRAHAALGRDN